MLRDLEAMKSGCLEIHSDEETMTGAASASSGKPVSAELQSVRALAKMAAHEGAQKPPQPEKAAPELQQPGEGGQGLAATAAQERGNVTKVPKQRARSAAAAAAVDASGAASDKKRKVYRNQEYFVRFREAGLF